MQTFIINAKIRLIDAVYHPAVTVTADTVEAARIKAKQIIARDYCISLHVIEIKA